MNDDTNQRLITEKIRQYLKSNLAVCNYIAILIVVGFAIRGPWYLFLFIPLWGCFLIWLHWEQYTMGMEMVERSLWGNTLNYYRDEGIPRPKLKFVWRKPR